LSLRNKASSSSAKPGNTSRKIIGISLGATVFD
jgi:hypothetical protein